jgi:alcohol dehydrogenase
VSEPASGVADPGFGVLRLPDHVHFGAGSLASLPVAAAEFGTRVFVCADPFLAGTAEFSGALDALERAGLDARVSTDVVPELPVASIEAVADAAREFRPDVVVGFGGGSALDLAKLVALLLVHPAPLGQYLGENRVPGPIVPVIAVPTTAGTGSEVTPVAVVSDPARELKVGVSSPFIVPRYAIVDPRLSYGAPPRVAAYAGIDALVHGVESFTARVREPDWSERLPVFVGRNRLSSLVGIEAVRLIGANLGRAVLEPGDTDARDAMAYGSMLAGMAFGTGGTHISHALQYPVGALTHTPHGLGTGLLLPYVMQAALPETVPELAEIGAALGVGGADPGTRARAAIAFVRELTAAIGIPETLAEIGIERAQLPRIAELALTVARLANNATIPADPQTFGLVLEAAFDGDRSVLPQ